MVSWVDIVLAVILVGTFIAGLVKGLVKEAVGIAAVLVGFIIASRSYVDVAGFIQKVIREPMAAKFIGFIIVFLAVLILGLLVAVILSKLMAGPLKFVNHLLGGVFGLVEGILICGVLVFALLVFPISRGALAGSKLASYCYGLTKAMVRLIPKDLKNQFSEAYQNFIKIKSEKKNGQKI